jgi:hypothetical protein
VKACLRLAAGSLGATPPSCCALIFCHLAFWNAESLLRAAADIVRFTGAELVDFVPTGFDPFRIFAHRACCARAILRREDALITLDGADTVRVG